MYFSVTNLPKKNNNISELNEKINNVNLSSSSELKGKSLNEELIDESDDEESDYDESDVEESDYDDSDDEESDYDDSDDEVLVGRKRPRKNQSSSGGCKRKK